MLRTVASRSLRTIISKPLTSSIKLINQKTNLSIRMISSSSKVQHEAPIFRLEQPTAAEEEADFQSQISSIQTWFDSPRYASLKRNYSAEIVASKRGTQPISPLHSSNISAKKLWAALERAAKEGRPLNTMGAIDPIQMTQMAEHLEVLYVSGWASSSVLTTGNNEVGPDLG